MRTRETIAHRQRDEAGMDLVSEASEVVARNTQAVALLQRTTRSKAFALIIGLALVKSRIDYRPRSTTRKSEER